MAQSSCMPSLQVEVVVLHMVWSTFLVLLCVLVVDTFDMVDPIEAG